METFLTECPEWCDHDGQCADDRAAMHRAEAYAEGAWDRAMELGLDDELEREARLGIF
jgi:hypothetical protein